MAGHPQRRQQLLDTQAQLEQARERIRELEARTGFSDFELAEPRTLSDVTRKGLIHEMLARADRGESLDQVAAAWNISSETLKEWCKVDVAFGEAASRARTRAKAATLAALQRSLEAGKGVPAAFVDMMLARYDAGGAADEGGDGLISVQIAGPSDCWSCPNCGHVVEPTGDRQTADVSDGPAGP